MAKKRRKVSRVTSKASNSGNKMALAMKNFVLFLVLFLVSLIFYHFASSELFLNLFGILSAIFAFLSLAFLIVLAVLTLTQH